MKRRCTTAGADAKASAAHAVSTASPRATAASPLAGQAPVAGGPRTRAVAIMACAGEHAAPLPPLTPAPSYFAACCPPAPPPPHLAARARAHRLHQRLEEGDHLVLFIVTRFVQGGLAVIGLRVEVGAALDQMLDDV